MTSPFSDEGENQAAVWPRPPFSLPLTVRVLQRRPTNRVDLWRGETYRRVLSLQGGPRLVTVRQEGDMEAPQLCISVAGERLGLEELERTRRVVAEILGTQVDTAPFHEFAEADPLLGPLVRSMRGLKPPRFPTLWETFLNVVVFQQISLLAALAIVGRLVERFGKWVKYEGDTYFAYPEAPAIAAASVDELRALGLSLNKAVALRALAEAVGDGEALKAEISALPSPAAIERLTQLPGIGRWSAEVVLLRGLGRLDVFPGADSGVIRGLAEALGRAGGLAKGEERLLAERFDNWRGMLYLVVVGDRLRRQGLLSP